MSAVILFLRKCLRVVTINMVCGDVVSYSVDFYLMTVPTELQSRHQHQVLYMDTLLMGVVRL